MKKIILFSSLLMLFGSCSKDEPAPTTNPNDNTNTTPEFTITSSTGTAWKTKKVQARIIAGNYVLVAESETGAAVRFVMPINLSTITKDTLKLKYDGTGGRAVYYEAGSKETDGYATDQYNSQTPVPGWVKFTAYNGSKRTADGTFSLKLLKSNSFSTDITISGSFKNIAEDTTNNISFPKDSFAAKFNGSPINVTFYTGGATAGETRISFLGVDDVGSGNEYSFLMSELLVPGTYTTGEQVSFQYNSSEVKTGTVIITKNDALWRVIQGTFSGETTGGDLITEGSFSLVY